MKDKAKIRELINQKSSFLLTAHIFPDGDNIGSLLALRAALQQLGKRVQVAVDDAVPANLHFLAGIEHIKRAEEITPDFQVLMILDSSSVDRIGAVQKYFNEQITVVNIDHHISNTGFGNIQYLDAAAAATAEIIFDLLVELNVTIDSAMANALFTGIATDCGFFKYANTTVKAMEIAGKMLACGARPQEISDALESKSLPALKLLARVLEQIQVAAQGKLAWLSIDEASLKASGASHEDTDGFINYVRFIQGVEVALLFREVPGRGVKVSMRSKGAIDVNQLAQHFGGGGHQKAAGCSFEGSLQEATERVVRAVEEQLRK